MTADVQVFCDMMLCRLLNSYGVISRKPWIFISIAVRSPNLAKRNWCYLPTYWLYAQHVGRHIMPDFYKHRYFWNINGFVPPLSWNTAVLMYTKTHIYHFSNTCIVISLQRIESFITWHNLTSNHFVFLHSPSTCSGGYSYFWITDVRQDSHTW